MTFETTWTVERVERLRKMQAGKTLSASEMAAELGGVSRNSVIGKLTRMGLNISSVTCTGKRRVLHRAVIKRGDAGIGRRIRHNFTHKPPQAPQMPAEPASETNCTIMELTAYTCRWPLGEPTHDMLYCGGMAVDGLPYCGAHCRMAYQPARKSGT